MNNDFRADKQQFEDALKQRLFVLGSKWDIPHHEFEQDSRYAEALRLGTALLLSISIARLRLQNKVNTDDQITYLTSLSNGTYTPSLGGSSFRKDTPAYADVTKFLKDLAFDVGILVEQKESLVKEAASKQAVHTGFDSEAEGVDVIEIHMPHTHFDWNAITVPADIQQDDRAQREDEKSRIGEIVTKSSAVEVEAYLHETLRPRFREIALELIKRRGKYATDEAYQMGELELINFKDSVGSLIQQAIAKTKSNSDMPYPILIDAADLPPAQSRKPEPKPMEKYLSVMRTDIAAYVDGTKGDELKQFYEQQLKPKFVELFGEVKMLKKSGHSPEQLDIKERHLAVLKEGMAIAMRKINAEVAQERSVPPTTLADIPVLTDILVPAPSTTVTPVISKVANEPLSPEALRARRQLAQIVIFPRSTNAKAANDATEIAFKEVPANKPKANWFKRTAIAAALAVATIVGGFVTGIAIKENNSEAAAAQAKVTATAQFNDVAAPSANIGVGPVQIIPSPFLEAKIDAALADEAEAKVPAKADKVATPNTPAPQVTKVRTSFKNASGENIDIVSGPIVAKPFDIATSRTGIDTWVNACNALKERGVQVDSGVCPVSVPS